MRKATAAHSEFRVWQAEGWESLLVEKGVRGPDGLGSFLKGHHRCGLGSRGGSRAGTELAWAEVGTPSGAGPGLAHGPESLLSLLVVTGQQPTSCGQAPTGCVLGWCRSVGVTALPFQEVGCCLSV